MNSLRVVFTIMLLWIGSGSVFGQFLSATDTSENSVRRYKTIINANKDIVKFIEYSLVQKGLPRHLRNLALIESSFNTNVISGAGAVGVWQFMTSHANQYGLSEQNRNDLYKSTKTAVVSLSNLYKKYNNWVTVVAAYNCGEGNISKAMQAAGSSQYHIFYKYLPAETINHVNKYLNACYATGELQSVLANYNSSRMNTVFLVNGGSKISRPELAETDINAGFNLKVIADELHVNVDQLLAWNPGINETLQRKGESSFYLPMDLMPDFLMRKNKILSRSIKESSPVSQ
ncbi:MULTISPECIES: lytic transglycosylase domain-containing protein [Chryseobacterium]|uniref:Membrane-bound lytic murein transglycosylase D n=1 Tax=Chryseobacterium camelliae TaxID=1265445 RepID=A0ABU0TJL1_9FLAO|nr:MULTISPECIES: lytic transglycosylase domain-containing protein [Chryseobacterium]MDT3408920.1 membrane-bound lytic murein transglycosylase D [Pseudacidovorax intermedius]MDQ1097224.1 membrane-bound lytic murein transglycosylase D [Chryseobacterium camelliae]MDQ1101159.1 membrane-bound lytic murein transglycosylase D [Chryseobacterium sp. SORGH_AS_1048]MDR6084604.1 membrane-bound lytic murein transglycosylase D [Chryseobacterium sp. SORGH_AS_0909]MDR6132876.1 membrane-bound lytic murein tran